MKNLLLVSSLPTTVKLQCTHICENSVYPQTKRSGFFSNENKDQPTRPQVRPTNKKHWHFSPLWSPFLSSAPLGAASVLDPCRAIPYLQPQALRGTDTMSSLLETSLANPGSHSQVTAFPTQSLPDSHVSPWNWTSALAHHLELSSFIRTSLVLTN